jgi:magnesium transporter
MFSLHSDSAVVRSGCYSQAVAMHATHSSPSLTLLLGTAVLDASGASCGRLQDIAVLTGPDTAGQVAGVVVKSGRQLAWVSARDVYEVPGGALKLAAQAELQPLRGDESFILLRQDLLDRQIIDVHGRKVVRVNDVDLQWFAPAKGLSDLAAADLQAFASAIPDSAIYDLRVREVEVGLRGAVRRLLLGLAPRATVARIACQFPARVIPWDFVDLIEADPARRVKLKMSHERLAQLHPSDIAEILDDLAPAEREAIFSSLDEGVAADALEEADPGLQRSLLESMDSERIAGILEEMDPEAAADLLSELSDEHSEAILEEMDPDDRQEVEELLEFREDSAAGRMTTDFVAVPQEATAADAIAALRGFEGNPETVTEVYLLDEQEHLRGVVPLARVLLAQSETRMAALSHRHYASIEANAHQREVAELFDKYNLRALAVVDKAGKLVGVVEADHVIAFLRGTR